MQRPTRREPRLYVLAALGLGAVALMHTAAADIVQATVAAAGPNVVIKDTGGRQASELAGGPFQIQFLPGASRRSATRR
jgi:hypothetical protein